MAERAIVLGGGIAGLAAVVALADGTRQVTLVERDGYPRTPAPRAGAPQSRHVHTLLLRGAAELDALIPGAVATLTGRGALRLDWGLQRFHGAFGRSPRFVSGLIGTFCSRGLIEHLLWEHALARPGVTVLEKHEVVGLLGDSGRVRGVRVRARGPAADPPAGASLEAEIPAELVIDATGRTSSAPQWLANLGVGPPPETQVVSGLGYAARVYRRPPEPDPEGELFLVRRPRPWTGGGVRFPIEGDRWIVGLWGTGAELPPKDEAGYAALAARLPGGFADSFAGAEPLSPIVTYRATASRWRHWERVPDLPRGLLVMADALCCFNPVYGQGMTVALAQARLLRDVAGEDRLGDEGLPKLQRAFGALARGPWTMTTQEDFRYPETVGRRPRGFRLSQGYADRVLEATAHDPAVFVRFLEVSHLVKPQRALLAPDIVRRVLQGRVTSGRAAHLPY